MRCTFLSLEAAKGGAIGVQTGELSVDASRFIANRADEGGALAIFGGRPHLSNTLFINNTNFLSFQISYYFIFN